MSEIKQVKLAIDSIDALFIKLRSELEDGERRDIEGLLTNLRLNFVEKSSAGSSGAGDSAKGPASE